MPPKKVLEATFYIIDLNTQDKEKQRDCYNKIISKICLTQSQTKNQDVYKLALVGTNDTENDLNYKNIKVVHDWQFYDGAQVVGYLRNLYEGCGETRPSNVYEALYLACHHLMNDRAVLTHRPKRIVLLSDLHSTPPTNIKNFTMDLGKFLNNGDIWLFVLGPQVKVPYLGSLEEIERWSENIELADNSSTAQAKNLQAVLGMMRMRLNQQGLVADFDVGLHLQFYCKPELKPPYPWYAELMIGDQITISINVVKLVSEAPSLKFPCSHAGSEPSEMSKPQFTVKNPDTGELLTDSIPAYKIKGRCLVISAEKEKEQRERQESNEEKCFDIKYFIERNVLCPLYYEEESLSAVVADTRVSEEWQGALDVLAEAMHALQVAAVVKRVYARGPQFAAAPYVMFTCSQHGPACLLLAQWPTSEELELRDGHMRGQPPHSATNPKMQAAVDEYLTAVSADREELCDEGRVLHCLSDHIMQNPDMMSQCKHFIKSHLQSGHDRAHRLLPELHMHSMLVHRGEQYLSKVLELQPELKNHTKHSTF